MLPRMRRINARLRPLYNVVAVALTVFIPLSLTLSLWDREKTRAERDAKIEFEFRVGEGTEAIRARMRAYEQVLRGAAALFSISRAVTREDWRDYVRFQRLSTTYPGIASIAYAPVVGADNLASFLARNRLANTPAFRIFPEGARRIYVPNLYVEPFAGRNVQALGFDLYSDPARRSALNIARDTGEPTLSARLTLAQDAGEPLRPGVSIYVPVYERGRDHDTPAQRRAALTGFVVGGFRISELLAGIFTEQFRLEVRISDGAPGAALVPLGGNSSAGMPPGAARFTAQQSIELNNRVWLLHFASTPAFESAIDHTRPQLTLIGGLMLSALLIALILLLATTRNRAVRLARYMYAELHAMNDDSPLGIVRTDADGQCDYVNQAFERISGLRSEQARGDGWLSAVHPEDRERVVREWHAALSENRPYESVHRLLRSGGTTAWASVKAAPIRNRGGVIGYTASVDDITERKRTAEALRESEERLTFALQGSNLALVDWNVQTGQILLSDQWAHIVGAAPGATSTTIQEFEQLVHPEDLPHLRQQLAGVLKGTLTEYTAEHRIKTNDGSWRWILSSAKVTQRDAAGIALRLTGTNLDISRRKAVEHLKEEFIATLSHELRTPLTVIVGSLAMLQDGSAAKLPADEAMMLDMACQNSARLQKLIDNMLDFKEMSSDATGFALTSVELGPLLQRAIDLNRAYADSRQVAYELREPLPRMAVLADPERLTMVVTNLLSNAVKYSPAGATVTISARTEAGFARVMITDRGPGVPPEFRDRIFQSFAQADGSNTRQSGGAGLGLSISKAIIEKFGGRIGYESEPGRGATFFFELPLST